MAIVDDKRLEELRKFWTTPIDRDRTPEEINDLVRDMTWAVEELQLRRVNERVKVPETPKPYLLFGSDEEVLAFVDSRKIPPEDWTHVQSLEDVRHVMPNWVQAVKLAGADPKHWEAWEKLAGIHKIEEPVK